ncbi:MAG: dihydrolipoyllysine-residue succinyltransferase [Pantoea sp. Brub]|nr:dihydrolipoyllysine-residue succinyltransferase [Pantoea sp. Brub]
MSIVKILVPELPESVIDASVAIWHKKPGDVVKRDEILVEIETDKIILEVPSITNGILETILECEGAIVTAQQILGLLKETHVSEDMNNECKKDILTENNECKKDILTENNECKKDILTENNECKKDILTENNESQKKYFSPSMRRLIAKQNLDISNIKDNDCNQNIILQENKNNFPGEMNNLNVIAQKIDQINRNEKRVPMTRLRKRIAERLINAKNNTAMLTTFNEVNMLSIINIRKKYSEIFEKRHNVRLGLMSFYIKAATAALKFYPEINAFIDHDDIIYHDYFDINIAISTPRGLVTPVLYNVDILSMADIEKKIKELASKGKNGKLTVEDLNGGNFTITNGGVFGSLMSTPIINPPQSAILGIHVIKERPVAVDGKVVILPMMYLALSYDHRIIDGRESIGYLVKVKEFIEDPTRLLMDI